MPASAYGDGFRRFSLMRWMALSIDLTGFYKTLFSVSDCPKLYNLSQQFPTARLFAKRRYLQAESFVEAFASNSDRSKFKRFLAFACSALPITSAAGFPDNIRLYDFARSSNRGRSNDIGIALPVPFKQRHSYCYHSGKGLT